MTSRSEKRGRRCRFERDIPAYLQDELPAKKHRRFEDHVAACSSCASDLRAYERLMAGLRAEPAAFGRDLSDAVRARIVHEIGAAGGGRGFAPAWVRAAAVLACCGLVGGLFFVLGRTSRREIAEPVPDQRAVEAALAWLKAAQEPDGHWNAARWGAQANYTPGITALALLALVDCGPESPGHDGAAAVRRGIEYLLGQQNEEGRFGRLCSGTPYNQGMATLALLRATRSCEDPRWRPAVDRALAYIQATQLESGGWGYPQTAVATGNTSITVWQLLALLEAEAAGRPNLRPHIDRGMTWLEGMMDAEGRIGYTRPGDFPHGHLTLTAAAALCLLRDPQADRQSEHLARITRALLRDAQPAGGVDYYRAYFMSQALRATGGDQGGMLLHRLRAAVLAHQVRQGPEAGSFEAKDPWSAAGGRVYATAMAVLAM